MPATQTDTRADNAKNVEDVERAVGVPWRSPTLLAILAATLMTPMDVPLVSPVLPEIGAAFGVSESRAGLFLSLYALPGILLAPVIGALADRVGRRYVLSGCLTLFGLAGAAIAFTSTFWAALALRLLQGVAAGSILAALAMTVVGDRYAGRQHDAVMGVTAAMLSLGTAVYPLVGGYLATYAWNAPFLVYAFTLPVAGFVLIVLDDRDATRESRTTDDRDATTDSPETPRAADDRGYVREAIHAIPISRALALYGVMFVSFTLLFGGIYTALPFYLVDAFGFSVATVGLVTSAMLLVTAAFSIQNGKLAARWSTTALLVVGFALYSVGFLGVALAGHSALLIGALLVFGAGSGLVTPTLFAGISALAPDHVRAGVMSLQTTTIGVSQAVGPALFGLLGATVGYQVALLGASGGAALSTAALSVLPLEA